MSMNDEIDYGVRNDPGRRMASVRAAIAAQHAKKPRVDHNGRPVRYDAQPETYRAVVTQAEHEAAHGVGRASAETVDHSGATGPVQF